MRAVKLNARCNVRTLLAVGLLAPALALAGEAPQSASAAAAPFTPLDAVEAPAPAQAFAPAPETTAMGPVLAPEALEQYRGGSATIHSEAVSNGLLQNATATRVATGSNAIADGSFSHAVGMPIVIQNSGANVLIQNSTIVNVQFR